jgi:TRAP transporter 4TM/12TM fusion protein
MKKEILLDGGEETKEVDSGSYRNLIGNRAKIVSVIAILFSLFQIYVNSFANVQEIYRNAIHLSFLLFLTFILYPSGKKSPKNKFTLIDSILGIAGIIGGLYMVFFFNEIHVTRGSQAFVQDYIFAVITIILLLEAARRTIGLLVPILCIIFMAFAHYGPYMPGMFGHAGFTWERLLFRLYMTNEGIFGITIAISSTYIFLFILFGSFLKKSGAAELFNDISLAVAGRRRGGPAQVAVISSALMGTLSGSPVANVATTGAFTIPLMKKIGYKPYYAGAVEAAASTGGLITPPIMGAAAFIMTGFLGVPFSTIILAAIIPALLYYVGIIIMVDIEAKRLGLKGLSEESVPKLWEVLKKRGVLLLPIVVIIWTLLDGKTPLYAGFAGIITTIVASWFNKDTRIGVKEFFQALEDGGKSAVQVGMATAACGIIVGVVNMTGIGSVLSYNILKISGGVLMISLLLIMVTSIVLSMGLPSTALYIVVAVTAAPALVEMGVNPIAAHFFVFFFGALSNVTPPVALASFTAAGIAKSEPMKTSWMGLKLTLAGFIIPFIFVYNPIILLQAKEGGSVSIFSVLVALATALIGIYALAIAASNYFNHHLILVERILFFIVAFLLIKPGLVTDLSGFGVLTLVLAIHYFRLRKNGNKSLLHASSNENSSY